MSLAHNYKVVIFFFSFFFSTKSKWKHWREIEKPKCFLLGLIIKKDWMDRTTNYILDWIRHVVIKRKNLKWIEKTSGKKNRSPVEQTAIKSLLLVNLRPLANKTHRKWFFRCGAMLSQYSQGQRTWHESNYKTNKAKPFWKFIFSNFNYFHSKAIVCVAISKQSE